MDRDLLRGWIVGITVVLLLIGLIVTSCAVVPKYTVWQKGLKGKAALAEADWDRRILVKEGEAKRDAAVFYAEAEVARAHGVAEANQIIGESLKGNEGYLRYLWIQGLQDGSSEVIYIATEAGIPILEAGKR